MGLEIDPKQIEAARQFLAAAKRDPARMRLLMAAVAFVIGYVGLLMPYGGALEDLRIQQASASTNQAMATDVLMVLNQRHVYEPRLTAPADDVGWQAYILGLVERSGLSLDNMEPIRRESMDPFVVLLVELVATADSYSQVVDFVERLEDGARPLRLEQFTLEAFSGRLQIECSLQALVLEGTPDTQGAMRRASGGSDASPDGDDG